MKRLLLSPPLRLFPLVLGFFLGSSSLALAQTGGSPEAQAREVEVRAVDGGYVLEGNPRPTPDVAGAFVPPKLVVDSPAAYPKELESERLVGTVQLELLIGATGAVEAVRSIEASHPLFDAAAQRAAAGLEFTPAQVDGKELPVRLRFAYHFVPPQPLAVDAVSVLSGVVRAKGTRRPIPGAVLQRGDGSETVMDEADAAGRFSLTLPKGRHWLRVAAPGFKPGAFAESLEDGQAVEVVYALEPLRVSPYETVVRAERLRTEVSRVTLQQQEIREVPGTMGDPFRVVMLMPGVASLASGISYPVVRGSQPAATGYFIDGIRVPTLFHALVGPAVVHPDFLEGVDFYPGSAPPRFGRLLGGVIEGQVSRPRDDRLHATAYADLINAGGLVEYPFESTGTSVTVAGRYSYTPGLIALVAPVNQQNDGYHRRVVADFYDYQARLEQKLGQGKLRLLAFGASDVAGFASDHPNEISARGAQLFHRVDLRHRHPAGPGELELGVTYGTERIGISGELGEKPAGEYALTQSNYAARAGWAATFDRRLAVMAGADVEHRRAKTIVQSGEEVERLARGEGEAFYAPSTLATLVGGYVQAVWSPVESWAVIPGLRFDSYHLVPGVQRLSLDPRLTVRHRLTERLTLKAGAGLVHQPPTVLVNLPVMDLAGLRYGLQEAAQLSAGAEWKWLEGLDVSLEGYFNPIFRAIEFDLTRVLMDRSRRNIPTGGGVRGRAFGAELMVRHPLGGNWFGWASYAYQRSERYERFNRFGDGNEILETTSGWVPFAFEQQHIVNAAVSYKFANNLTVGVSAHFNTGRPQTGELSLRSQHPGVDPDTGEPAWTYDDRDRVAPLPPFIRLDLRLSKSWAFDAFTVDAYLDVLNASLSRETLSYNFYVEEGELRRSSIDVPIVAPVLGLKASY